MEKHFDGVKRFEKEANGVQATAAFSEEILAMARELLAQNGNAGRREIVRASLELHRLLGEAS